MVKPAEGTASISAVDHTNYYCGVCCYWYKSTIAPLLRSFHFSSRFSVRAVPLKNLREYFRQLLLPRMWSSLRSKKKKIAIFIKNAESEKTNEHRCYVGKRENSFKFSHNIYIYNGNTSVFKIELNMYFFLCATACLKLVVETPKAMVASKGPVENEKATAKDKLLKNDRQRTLSIETYHFDYIDTSPSKTQEGVLPSCIPQKYHTYSSIYRLSTTLLFLSTLTFSLFFALIDYLTAPTRTKNEHVPCFEVMVANKMMQLLLILAACLIKKDDLIYEWKTKCRRDSQNIILWTKYVYIFFEVASLFDWMKGMSWSVNGCIRLLLLLCTKPIAIG
ncbi:hypothetical protein RFI_16017 [Reticulomyxa filosa]|uniref:Uncharacterized protein n=1 Tax=Reticulomyxa filosa TaxID=46433 RepID=X6N4G3_RETFI|nr:hypothetical protein RFI_16017 [Reticulomyxa filosa]|eukprot:ETO21185.1 hypothetical protein RFI_16017 [Reticulomyxa filosa]